jgi:glycosyltransferase involved in cell wall biosynthesis
MPPGLPDLSLVMPCYNEQDVVAETVTDLRRAFDMHGFDLELVAVDNGSTDRTGEILRELAAADPHVVPVRVEENQGYGHGILAGLPACRAPWVGIICADGQVDAEDVARLFRDAARSPEPKLFKVRRRFRMDGLRRKVVSVAYNLGTALLFPGLGSIDVNGNPKILPRDAALRMGLESKDWFLDAEIMIKARRMGLPVHETNVFARMRGGGSSNVRTTTCLEFARNLLRVRLGRALRGPAPDAGARRAHAAGSPGAEGSRTADAP